MRPPLYEPSRTWLEQIWIELAPLDERDEARMEELRRKLAEQAPPACDSPTLLVALAKPTAGITRHPVVITAQMSDPEGDFGAGLLTKLCPPVDAKGKQRRGPKVKLDHYAVILDASAEEGRQAGAVQMPPTCRASLITRILAGATAEARARAKKVGNPHASRAISGLTEISVLARIHKFTKLARDWRKPPPTKGTPRG